MVRKGVTNIELGYGIGVEFDLASGIVDYVRRIQNNLANTMTWREM